MSKKTLVCILCILLCSCSSTNTKYQEEIQTGIMTIKDQQEIEFTYKGNVASPCEIKVTGNVHNKEQIEYSLETTLCDGSLSYESVENGSQYRISNDEKKLIKNNVNQYPSYLTMLFDFEFSKEEIQKIDKKEENEKTVYTITYTTKYWDNYLNELDQSYDEQIAQYQANTEFSEDTRKMVIQGLEDAKARNHALEFKGYTVSFTLENEIIRKMTSTLELKANNDITTIYYELNIK